ncbi:shikimate kinase [Pyrococcus sp. NA2]|uniref:shikimate kinase n=1 Tax=Pyrococcus sp. (strain NA2) TaxID=342949 RepID=UPI000209A8ED|nr:shikimate kinase [Pyrococcus sp. NA2]AEC51235.1 shikimate kinase [Pyrococcus sp. NA2]
MKGYGEAGSAITVINAFATGKGAAVGIDMWTRAEVEITGEGIEGEIFVRGRELKDHRLVSAAVEVFTELLGEKFGVKFRITSDIPVGKGLKSSSAAANAISFAISEALKLELSEIDIIKLGVEIAKRAGVTITGAFDDACASYFGGLCITDNINLRVLLRERVEVEDVVILIPEQTVLTEKLKGIDFSVLSPYIEVAFKLAMHGEWKKALVINGLVYSTFLGYDPRPIREALKLGAFVGLCGKGPSIFALTEKVDELVDAWKEFGEVIVTRLR